MRGMLRDQTTMLTELLLQKHRLPLCLTIEEAAHRSLRSRVTHANGKKFQVQFHCAYSWDAAGEPLSFYLPPEWIVAFPKLMKAVKKVLHAFQVGSLSIEYSCHHSLSVSRSDLVVCSHCGPQYGAGVASVVDPRLSKVGNAAGKLGHFLGECERSERKWSVYAQREGLTASAIVKGFAERLDQSSLDDTLKHMEPILTEIAKAVEAKHPHWEADVGLVRALSKDKHTRWVLKEHEAAFAQTTLKPAV